MILKLILFIAAIVAFLFYVGFNLDNKCNIWLFVKTFENVPVFMNSLISFAFGILCSLPFAIVRKVKKQKQIQQKTKPQNPLPPQEKSKSSASKRSSLLAKIQTLKTEPENSDTNISADTAGKNTDENPGSFAKDNAPEKKSGAASKSKKKRNDSSQ